MSDAKSKVAAMMKLPKAERLNQLVEMSRESISAGEDASALLELIQMELDAPDTPTASRPASVASSAPGVAADQPAPAKSMRRQLTEKRNELRAMLAQVDRALGPSSATPSSRGATPTSRQGDSPQKRTTLSGPVTSGAARLSQSEIDALLRRAEGGKAQVRGARGYESSVASIL